MVLPNVSVAIRGEPSLAARAVGSVSCGDTVTVLANDLDPTGPKLTDGSPEAPQWLRVVQPVVGFCIASHPMAAALRTDGKMFLPEDENIERPADMGESMVKKLKMDASSVAINVRAQPSMNARVVGAIKEGDVITTDRFIRGINGMDWYRLSAPYRGAFCIAAHPLAPQLFVPFQEVDATATPADFGFAPFEPEEGVPMVLYVDNTTVRIRRLPTFSSEAVGEVQTNQRVKVMSRKMVSAGGVNTEWLQITSPARGFVIGRHESVLGKGFPTDELFCQVGAARPVANVNPVEGVALSNNPAGYVDGAVIQDSAPSFAHPSATYI